MSAETTELDEPLHGTRLKDWRSTPDVRRTMLRKRSTVLLCLVVTIGLFLFATLRPLSTPNLTIVAVGPDESQDHPTSAARQAADESSRQLTDFARTLPTARVDDPHTFSGDPGSKLAIRSRVDPLIIHIAGSPSVKNGRPMVKSPQSQRNAASGSLASGALDIAELLGRLRTSESKAVVLLDMVEDRDCGIGVLPELTAWRFAHRIEQQIGDTTEGQIAVVLSHARVRTAEGKPPCFVLPLASRFRRAFGIESDVNGDHSISVAELLRVLNPSDPEGQRRLATTTFSNISVEKWRRVLLAPVSDADGLAAVTAPEHITEDVTEDESAGSEPLTPEPDQSEATGSPPETSVPTRSLAASAPTLPLAIGLQRDGLETHQGSTAIEIAEMLRKHLNVDSQESDATTWLTSPEVESVHWDEIAWARTVMGIDVPWPLKQELIRCRALANQVALRPTVRRWFGDNWTSAQWKRLAGERTLTSPVRHDDQEYIREIIDDAIRQYRSLATQADIVDRADKLCREIRRNIDELIAEPVRARTPKDDVVCQLLLQTLQLQASLDLRQAGAIHDYKRMSESIAGHRSAIRRLATDARAKDARATLMTGVSDRFVENTRIRIVRSALAIRLQRRTEDDASFDQLRSTARHAVDVLSNSSASKDEIVTSSTAFQREAIRSRDPATLRTSAANEDLANQPTERWANIIACLADDMQRFASDATPDERQWRNQSISHYSRLALALGHSTTDRVANDFRIQTMTRGSLAVSDRVTVDIVIKKMAETADDGQLEIEYDDRAVAVRLSEPNPPADATPAKLPAAVPVKLRVTDRDDYRSVATRRLSTHEPRAAFRVPASTQIELQRLTNPSTGFRPERTAINVRWVTLDDVYRTSVTFDLPLQEIANVSVEPVSQGTLPSNPFGDRWTMHANRVAHRRLSVEPLEASTNHVQIRLLGWKQSELVTPPPMTRVRADQWLSERARPAVLAHHPDLAVSPGVRTPVLFPPKKTDPASPKIPIGSLWVEVTDTDRKIVQMIDISPQVYRPSSLVRPEISYDHVSQMASFTMHDQLLLPDRGDTHVHIKLTDPLTGDLVARSDVLVSPGTSETKVISAAAARGNPVCARLIVDQWPSAFVYEFESDRSFTSLSPSRDHAAIAIVSPPNEIIANKSIETIEADVWVDVSDSVFQYGEDTVTLGLDVNGDRFLDGDPSVAVSTPVEVKFQWAGVSDEGHVGIHSIVTPHRLAVPAGLVRDRRIALAAKLQRGDRVTWSRPLAVVFDSTPPKVSGVEFASPLPAVLGAPADLRIDIDDGGLSGAASVQGGWAVDGGVEFTPAVKPLPAQKLGDGRWALALPTDKLASGVHQLLIQATDRAGNQGPVKAVPVTVRSEAELLAAEEKETTIIQGKIAYVTRPVAGMKVALKAKVDEKAKDPSEKKAVDPPETSKFNQEAQTTEDGSFEFSGVTEGDYEINVEGLYRGMRYRKQVEIAVKPPEPATVPTIRID